MADGCPGAAEPGNVDNVAVDRKNQASANVPWPGAPFAVKLNADLVKQLQEHAKAGVDLNVKPSPSPLVMAWPPKPRLKTILGGYAICNSNLPRTGELGLALSWSSPGDGVM
jgi:hypothetical protein